MQRLGVVVHGFPGDLTKDKIHQSFKIVLSDAGETNNFDVAYPINSNYCQGVENVARGTSVAVFLFEDNKDGRAAADHLCQTQFKIQVSRLQPQVFCEVTATVRADFWELFPKSRDVNRILGQVQERTCVALKHQENGSVLLKGYNFQITTAQDIFQEILVERGKQNASRRNISNEEEFSSSTNAAHSNSHSSDDSSSSSGKKAHARTRRRRIVSPDPQPTKTGEPSYSQNPTRRAPSEASKTAASKHGEGEGIGESASMQDPVNERGATQDDDDSDNDVGGYFSGPSSVVSEGGQSREDEKEATSPSENNGFASSRAGADFDERRSSQVNGNDGHRQTEVDSRGKRKHREHQEPVKGSLESDKIAESADGENTRRLTNGENQQKKAEGNRTRSHDLQGRGAYASMNASSSYPESEPETSEQSQRSLPPFSSLPLTGSNSDGASAAHFETSKYQQVGDQHGARKRSGKRHDYSGDTSGSTHNTQHDSHVYSSLPDANIYKSMVGDHAVMIYRKDITKTGVEAIVNAANSGLENIGAVARAIAAAAGSSLERECWDIMKNRSFRALRETEVQVTRGGSLCKFVLHAVGPNAQYSHWSRNNLKHSLENTFLNCLGTAENQNVRSIAIPALGSGLHHYPESFVGEALCAAVGQFCTKTGTGGTLREIHLVDIDEKQTKETNSQFKRSTLFGDWTALSADRHTQTNVASVTSVHDSGARPAPGGAEHQRLPSSGKEDVEDCVICFDALQGKKTKRLKCGHTFCVDCIDKALKMRNACPVCSAICGKITGNQPQDGTMTSRKSSLPLPGYEKCGSIVIYYSFRAGVQGPEHQKPGKKYDSTRRTAYLPDNKEGREVLKLLERAFDARLTFTIGQSVTTGMNDQVTWNDIHHKTSTHGGSFGYPDNTYLQRVKEELAAKGIR